MTRTTITATFRPRQQSSTAQVSQGTSHSHGAAATTQSCTATGIRTRSTTLRPQSSDHHSHKEAHTFPSRTDTDEITGPGRRLSEASHSQDGHRQHKQARTKAPPRNAHHRSSSQCQHPRLSITILPGLPPQRRTTLHNLASLSEKRKTMLCERSHRLSPSLPPLDTFPCLAMATNPKRNTSQTGFRCNNPTVEPSPTKR